MSEQAPCKKHHWHKPRDPYRSSKRGFKQAMCCRCGKRGWVKLSHSTDCCQAEFFDKVMSPLAGGLVVSEEVS